METPASSITDNDLNDHCFKVLTDSVGRDLAERFFSRLSTARFDYNHWCKKNYPDGGRVGPTGEHAAL
jgi:hypothetical protein